MYEIRSDIPMPEKGKHNGYPTKKLDVGQMFFVPDETKLPTLRSTAYYHNRKGQKKFSVRKMELDGTKGIGFFRIK